MPLRKSHDIDVPDVPARAFNDGKGLTHMIVGATGAHTMVGPSILNQTRQCQYSWNQTADPNPTCRLCAWGAHAHFFAQHCG